LIICIPVSSFVEKNSTFLNLNKMKQNTNQAIDLNLNSTACWLEKLFYFLSFFDSQRFPNEYSNYSETQQNRSYSNLRFESGSIPNSVCEVSDEEQILFRSNMICKNSVTLASCARLKTWSNF
jgi:hypothetical protein